MVNDPVQRKLAAILAADVVGFSSLMERDEEHTYARIGRLRREVIEPRLSEERGRLIKTTGDGFLAEFASSIAALRCALSIQGDLSNDPGSLRMRIGLNLGDVIVEDCGDVYGEGVNVAARLEALCDPGGILISGKIHSEVDGKVEASFEDRGEQQVKNISRPVRIFSVLPPGIAKMTVAPTSTEVLKKSLQLPDKPSIAVLPFQNMSGDPEQEYFADGIVEDIITALSRIRWLFVIARNSSFIYKGKAIDVKQVGRDLGVRYVLEGSVRKGGNRIRITAQLIDALTGAHLWVERYDRDISDIFAVQDEIASSAASIIEPALTAAEQERVLRKPPERLDAWEAYQRGLWHFYKYRSEENKTALTFFRQAIALDPNFAPGHYGYALALQWDIWHFSSRPFAEVQGTAREEAQIAVSLDDKDAMAHAVLAHMMMWAGEWEAAIAEARTAFALNPNSAFVISMLGCVLGFGGYREEALEKLQQAVRASPHDPLIWLWSIWRGVFQFFSRDFSAALQTTHEVARLRPNYTINYELMAAALAFLGRLDDARAALDRIPPQSAEQLERLRQRPPWIRPEDFALRVEGVRFATEGRG